MYSVVLGRARVQVVSGAAEDGGSPGGESRESAEAVAVESAEKEEVREEVRLDSGESLVIHLRRCPFVIESDDAIGRAR
jgi:hypothetical protein